MCFVVDLHALETVDLLDPVDEVLLSRVHALDVEDVERVDRALGEVVPASRGRPWVNPQVLALRDHIALLLAVLVLDDDLSHTARDRAELHDAVDLGDDGRFLWLADLEELRHAGETAR